MRSRKQRRFSIPRLSAMLLLFSCVCLSIASAGQRKPSNTPALAADLSSTRLDLRTRSAPMNVDVLFPEKLKFLFTPHRYKVPYGGRGSAKSWSIARALLLIGKQPDILWPGWKGDTGIRILCYRETMR